MKSYAFETILRIKNPSTTQFLEMWKQYQPFIIEDVATHWDACNKWSNNYLREKCGNKIVSTVWGYEKDFLYNDRKFATSEGYKDIKMKLSEYIDYLENKVNEQNKNYDLELYLSERPFDTRFPEIFGDVTYPEYLNRKAFPIFWYGFSSKDYTTTTPLHFDVEHNIFVQIRGRKKMLLFPPSDYLSFYPCIEGVTGYGHHSKVLPHLLDLELFPKFPWQDKIEVILQPGEILYIPPFWWHHVTAVDENISLSFFYDLKIPDLFMQKKLLSTFLNIQPRYLPHYLYQETFSVFSLLTTALRKFSS